MKHHCHARDCETPVPPKLLMCRKHWFMVPRELQNAVWRYYVPGQEIRKDPTPEYMEAQKAAVEAVARKKGKI